MGKTKPPSRDASPTSVKPIGRLTPVQAADDAIGRKICIGCTTDPKTTGSLPASILREKRDVRLDELHTLAEPKQETDLDTVALASAHRERAKSTEEKTTGLWRSWLVSVCEGCGDQRPARALKLEDWPTRDVSMTTGVMDRKSPLADEKALSSRRVEVHPRRSLVVDLSTDNIDTIRRKPQ